MDWESYPNQTHTKAALYVDKMQSTSHSNVKLIILCIRSNKEHTVAQIQRNLRIRCTVQDEQSQNSDSALHLFSVRIPVKSFPN